MKKITIAVLLACILFGCTEKEGIINLVPNEVSTAPNYWCTWYWQNYLINKGQEVKNPDPKRVYSNKAAREGMNEETIFGNDGMAKVILPKSRGDYFFLVDHGWQDKAIKENTFFTLMIDTLDFPKYNHLGPKEKIKEMNKGIKALGWRGLALWVRGTVTEEEMRKFVEWSKFAGIEYWKIDGGDTEHFYATKVKNEIYPGLTLEHITGSGGPLNNFWDIQGLNEYPSVYSNQKTIDKKSEASIHNKGFRIEKALNVIKNTDVFRTYDAVPLLVSTVTMQRVHDILENTAGKSEYRAVLNIQDDCNIAAALGLVVGVKRHPMNTPRMYNGIDYHLQIAGDRQVDKRLNEMDRFVRWQRIAPPMAAGYGSYKFSSEFHVDSIVFKKSDTWYTNSHGKMVRQGAPAIMARNIALPDVKSEGLTPYVMASKFPNGAVAIPTEGRLTPDNSWQQPKADITLKEAELNKPIGIFGQYKSLTLEFSRKLNKIKIYGQDLMAENALNITKKVTIKGNKVIIPGDLIDSVGTMAGDEGDISAPGMVIKIIPN